MRAPFFWKAKDAWFIEFTKPDGKVGRKKLADTKTKAMEIWKAMSDSSSNPLVATVANEWARHMRARVKTGDIDSYYVERAIYCIEDYLDRKKRWSAFSKPDVTAYASRRYKSAGMVRTFLTFAGMLSKYGQEHFGLKHNLASIPKPPAQRREKLLEPAEYNAIIEQVFRNNRTKEHGFALALSVLWHTGARPGEIYRATRDQLQGDRIIQPKHKRQRKVARPRIIYLNLPARMAIGQSCNGTNYLFVNAQGNPWKPRAFHERVQRLAERAGIDPKICPYSFRHGYASRALSRGVDASVLAELMGTSVNMIEYHYGHLYKYTDVLRDAAASV